MDDQLLEQVSHRTRLHPEFLAWVFERYGQRRGPVAGRLAEHLGLSRRDFLRLGLYLRPRDDHFEADLRQTAVDFGTDFYRLAQVVRFVDAVENIAASSPVANPVKAPGDGFLAAAREREAGTKPLKRGRRPKPKGDTP